MKKKKKGSGNGAVLHRMLRGSVRYFVICILSGVTFTALELVIPQILRLTVDSVIGDKAADLPRGCKGSGTRRAARHISARTCSGLRWRWQWWGFCRRRSGTR
ncbi:MAG: hypothetical protein ACLSCX_04470 [Oscillospiraceae bacterium]